MGVLDSLYDQGFADNATPADAPVAKTGIFSNLSAGYRAARAGPASTHLHQNLYEAPYYDQVVNALNARGLTTTDQLYLGKPGDNFRSSPRAFRNPITGTTPMVNGDDPLGWSAREFQGIWAAVNQVRKSDPSFLKDLPDANALSSKALAERQRDLARSADIQNRATFPGQVAGFIGGLAGGVLEPESLVGGLGIGAGKTLGRTILKTAIEDATTNAAAGIVALPGQHADAATMGEQPTILDDAASVAEQGLLGAGLGAAKVIAPHVIKPIIRGTARAAEAAFDHLPQPIKGAAAAAALRAGTVDDRAITGEVRKSFTPFTVTDRATPEEKDALHTVERDADVREASPLHPAQDSANDGRLSAVMKSLGVDPKTPEVPTSAPMPKTGSARAYTGDVVGAINKAEGVGRNPQSSAQGYGQFVSGTWLRLYKEHFGSGGLSDADILAKRNDPAIGRQMTALYAQENGATLRAAGLEDSAGNLSLAHFLGAGGAKALLKAAADTPVERLLSPEVIHANERVLGGKSASEVIAWAHKRVGDASEMPTARADAVDEIDPLYDQVDETLPPVEHAALSPDEIETDAGLMQYKSGGDASGVTDRLAGVTTWNPLLSGKAVVWEGLDGRKVIVDGHQRLGLAKRLFEDDPSIRLDSVLIREADGITPAQARVIGALKNIAEGTGTTVDAARVLRDSPKGIEQLPPRAANVRTVRGLVGLSSDAFGAVLNDVIDPELAARIGLHAADRPETHMALVSLLHEARVTTSGQADTVIRQAVADGFGTAREHQLGMFGDIPQQSLYGPSARILEAAKRQLKAEKRSFKVLTNDASRIERAGNKLDRAANEAKVVDSDTAIAILDATAHSAGPVRTALLEAARASLDGDRSGAVRQFLSALDGIDLRSAARGVEERTVDGGLSERSGQPVHAGEADAELADGRGLPGGPTAYDEAVAAGQVSLGFSDPVGEAAKAQTAGLAHDLIAEIDPRIAERQKEETALKAASPMRPKAEQDGTMGLAMFDAADQPKFRLSENGDERTLGDILKETDADLFAADAAKACLQ